MGDSKPTEQAAADKCLEIGTTGPPILQLKAGYEPIIIIGRTGTNLSHLHNRALRGIGMPANQVSPGPSPSPYLARARSTHSSNRVSSKGLAKKPIAPALIACSRIRSSGNAVMKIIGVVLP